MVDGKRNTQHIYIIATHCAKRHCCEMKGLVPLNRYSHCFSSLIQLEPVTERSDAPTHTPHSTHTHTFISFPLSSVLLELRNKES